MAPVRAPTLKTIPLGLIHLFTKQIVPSLYQQSSTWSWLISMAQVFCTYLINTRFPSKTLILRASFFSFIFIPQFLWSCMQELAGSIFSNSLLMHSLCSPITNSFLSQTFLSALLPCMLYLSYYFQPEANT